MKSPIVSCQVCRGTGHKPLRGPLLRTLKAIERRPGSTIPQIAAALKEADVTNTAINKRVEKLEHVFKLVKATLAGGVRRYSVRNGAA